MAGSISVKLTKMGQQFQQWSCLRNRKQRKTCLDLEERLLELYSRDPSDEVLAEIKDVQLDLSSKVDKEEIV